MNTNPTSRFRHRKPKGTPTGGQFASETHAEPEVALDATPPAWLRLDRPAFSSAEEAQQWAASMPGLVRGDGPAINSDEDAEAWIDAAGDVRPLD